MSDISDRLLKSATHLGEMPSGALLLKTNAEYPWFIMVPHGDFIEWIDLPMELQQKLLTDINALSQFLLNDSELMVEKINVAAIGNIVPQFHLHIVGRHSEDPAWPGPVWGHEASREYEPGEVDELVSQMVNHVRNFDVL